MLNEINRARPTGPFSGRRLGVACRLPEPGSGEVEGDPSEPEPA